MLLIIIFQYKKELYVTAFRRTMLSELVKLEENIMWKLVNGRLIQTTDATRVKFRTNVSKSILDQLSALAEENDTYV